MVVGEEGMGGGRGSFFLFEDIDSVTFESVEGPSCLDVGAEFEFKTRESNVLGVDVMAQ